MSKKLVILCVDDERVVLDSLKSQLKATFGNKYLYETAESAEDALELVEELQQEENLNIILIVSDWLMPGMKGDDFLIEVHHRFPQILKIMLTGQADDTAIQRAMIQACLHSCLYKPWSEEQLISLVEAAVRQYE